MIYEMRTYTFAPGNVAEFERGFGEAIPHRSKYSPLGAFWKTEFGPLNQAIHVWPYESLQARQDIRGEAMKDDNWPPKHKADLLNQEAEILIPAPFMRDWDGEQELGNVYEMRTYTYKPGSINTVIERWADAITHREKYSPLAACWYTELGGLNKWIHVWPYASLEERDRVRAEASKDPNWPAPTREMLIRQEVKILTPASFSPMH